MLAGAVPLPSAGQPRSAQVAVLTPFSASFEAPGWDAFVGALRERGWNEGHNIVFHIRRTQGRPERLRDAAAELIALQPDVIVGMSTPAVQALREQTSTIPVVMRGVADPVASGFVASLARPSGNITGVSAQVGDLNEKFLQLLRDLGPGIARIALFWTPDNEGSRRSKEITAAVAPTLGISLEPIGVNTPEELDAALAVMSGSPPSALLVHATPALAASDQAIIAFAVKHRLPTLTHSSRMARNGFLLSYAPDLIEGVRLSADYVDRILRGAKPADLPVQQPTKFEFVINLKTARAIALELPPSFFALASEVIE